MKLPVAVGAQQATLVEIDLMAVEPKIDLSVPIIFVQTPRGNILPIDGYHRIAKAHKLGLKELPAVMLSKEDSKAIQI
jgi:ParB-like chromosome segregation protein Spo0J